MSAAGVRAGVAILVIGLLFVWLIRPIGNACPDVDKLPSGSTDSSAPSFAPPLTRTCTYFTPDGTQARKRYVPVLDWLLLLLVAGVTGGAVSVFGPGGGERPRAKRAERLGRQPRARRAPPHVPERARVEAAGEEQEESRRERDGAKRERARLEREARRRG